MLTCTTCFTLTRPGFRLFGKIPTKERYLQVQKTLFTQSALTRIAPTPTKPHSPTQPKPAANKNGETSGKKPAEGPPKRYGVWDEAETQLLLENVQKHRRNWAVIAANIPGRSPTQCAAHYYQKYNPSFKKGRWTVEEVEKLVELVRQYGPKWTFFSKILNRYPAQIRSRWIKCDSPNTKVRKWTTQEKAQLLTLVKKHGENWELIRKEFPNCSINQIGRIWREELAPGVRKGNWTLQEDRLLRELYSKMPNRWSDISKNIEGRTPSQCRTRWILALDPNINFAPWTAEELDILMEEIAINGRNWKVVSEKLEGRSPQQCRQRAKMLLSKGLGTIFVDHTVGPYVRYGWSDSNDFEQRYEGSS
ncbi:hypothetical protein K493DRAFT_312065 [Basidiobolus meristosporus CBS 931.73]|uniref:Homeodomain-like protein n=1 Tax=Basidiobolus meristosporus CBS 931.73 TaxID=1314790 RepID=A0A1Y1YXV7_9FUNG|nr:hypothetical protein K493DRAFT_312065 [Basidiobolus meristosporus CBS 931.73]|eukprot:ORY02405.1 hypothetical protein K493DRAFT_312065 [Basidiobolus meristosporus CBS 931.73]